MMDDKKFVEKIANEARLNMSKSYEQSGQCGTILKYKEVYYLRIKQLLAEINSEIEKDNIAIALDGKQLEENEVRVFYINTNHLE